MMNLGEIKLHKELTVQDAIQSIRTSVSVLKQQLLEENKTCPSIQALNTALDTWDRFQCGTDAASEEDNTIGILALTNAIRPEKIWPSATWLPGSFNNMNNMLDVIRHKMLVHTVDEDPMRGFGLSMRTGICPVCGQPVSYMMSEHECWFCGSKLSWIR